MPWLSSSLSAAAQLPFSSPSMVNYSLHCRIRIKPFQQLTFFTNRRRKSQIVRMAPDEEKMTRRSPLDFPIEWNRPKPGRRPDIFPQFSPMKTPLPLPLPTDPPEEDEEDEEKKEEQEEDPDQEETDKPNQ